MSRRDWSELPVHCLVEILERVGIESLVETIPLVCKSWYEATFYPQCWQHLVFTKSPFLRNSKCSIPRLKSEKASRFNLNIGVSRHINDVDDSLEKFVQFAIGRSHGLVSEVVFHPESRLKEGLIARIAKR